MRIIILAGLVVLTLTGCASQTVSKVTGVSPGDEICIINNAAVRKDFVDAYQASIEKIGYRAVIKKSDNHTCVVTSTYVANYGMHWGAYLARADLKIFKNGEIIGRAQYKAPRADPSKHGRVAGKIDKLVEELFSK